MITDVVCSANNNLILIRNEKLDTYFQLRLELARMWECETCTVTVIIGTFEYIPEDIYLLKKLDISCNPSTSSKELWC